MTSDIARIVLGTARLAADVVANLGGRLLTRHLPLAHHHADGLQVLPHGLIPNPPRALDREVVAPLTATVALSHRLVIAVAPLTVGLVQLGSEAGLHVFQQPPLVLLHRQDVMAAPFPNLPGNLLLASDGVNG